MLTYTTRKETANVVDTHLERILCHKLIRMVPNTAKSIACALDKSHRTVENWMQGRSAYGIAVLVWLLVRFPYLQKAFNEFVDRLREMPDENQLALPLGDA